MVFYDYRSEMAKRICGKSWSEIRKCANGKCTNRAEILQFHGNYTVVPLCKECFNKWYTFKVIDNLPDKFSFSFEEHK